MVTMPPRKRNSNGAETSAFIMIKSADGHGIAKRRPFLADGQIFVDSCCCLPQVPGARFLEFAYASLRLQIACFLMDVLSGSLAAQVYRQSVAPFFFI